VAILEKGLVQIYTGDGKGKTTAAFGLACRMLGRGGKVYIYQFLKSPQQTTGETILAERFKDQLTLERLPLSWNMRTSESDPQQVEQMRQVIKQKLNDIRLLVSQGEFDLVILDEIVLCLKKNLALPKDVFQIIEQRAPHVELVLTGRGADEQLISRADLVTHMQQTKHPYQRGTPARIGIEY